MELGGRKSRSNGEKEAIFQGSINTNKAGFSSEIHNPVNGNEGYSSPAGNNASKYKLRPPPVGVKPPSTKPPSPYRDPLLSKEFPPRVKFHSSTSGAIRKIGNKKVSDKKIFENLCLTQS